MKPEIAPRIVVRTPKFSWKSTLAECWPELIKDIALASPEFYQTIKEITSDTLDELPAKVKFTVWKYFNRSRYRATPFGTFGAFGIADTQKGNDAEPLVIADDFILHRFKDWPDKQEITFDPQELLSGNVKLFSNSTYYLAKNAIRYVANNNREFELAEIEAQPAVLEILRRCIAPIHANTLITDLNCPESEEPQLLGLLGEMIDLQLLFTEKEPNIIGKDYFQRMGITRVDGPTPYIISEIKILDGLIDRNKFRYLPELIHLLQQIVPKPANASLEKFVNAFTLKFEQNELPLMQALDPEIGVGYDDLEQGGMGNDLIRQLASKSGPAVKAKDVKEVLAGVLDQSGNALYTVGLESLEIQGNQENAVLPNSFSVMAHLADDLVFLESIGGATANALNGRFTLGSDEMLAHSRKLAGEEAAANPGVLFFDVAYMAEANVDNVNRRKSIYDHHVSILNYDTSDDPLTLNDILISVRGKEVILRSSKYNKRLIPRLASAYNYSRSDLSVFRLLCDIQHQQIHPYLTITVEKLFPGKSYYPRIQYKNLVVSPHKWRFNKQQFASIQANESGIIFLQQLLDDRNVPVFFRAGSADQTLCFNRDAPEDMIAFINYASRQNEFLIEEVLLPFNSSVINNSGKPLLAQFILTLQHGESIYAPFSRTNDAAGELNEQHFFAPGSEWVYFEIYCHTHRSDIILASYIGQLVEEFKPAISHWFFIRYNQNGNHIRLRIKLKALKFYQPLVTAFNNLLAEDMESGLIPDLQLKTYKRELARYGAELMDVVEKHFERDSTFVLALISQQLDDLNKYACCIRLAFGIQEEVFTEISEFTVIATKVSEAFNREHHLDNLDFKKLNAAYQQYLKYPKVAFDQSVEHLFADFKNSFVQTLNSAGPEKRKTLFSDLFHMHINRLFSEQQRTHEMMVYYFVVKEIHRQKALAKR